MEKGSKRKEGLRKRVKGEIEKESKEGLRKRVKRD